LSFLGRAGRAKIGESHLLLDQEDHMKKRVLALASLPSLFALLLFPGLRAQAASTTANAVQIVFPAISITKDSDLDFGSAPQGDAAKVVAPVSSSAAGFTVSGDPNRAYTITIPASASMVTTGGGAKKTIAVTSFVSSPSGTGTIGANGTQTLKVGATRAALEKDQVAGRYSGAFTVSVVY
jgi:hypothetical protein